MMEVRIYMRNRIKPELSDLFRDIDKIIERDSYTMLIREKSQRNVYINTDCIEAIYISEGN